MKSKYFHFLFMFYIFFQFNLASAAQIEDIKILSLEADPALQFFQLKLHGNNLKVDSFFFVKIVNTDPLAFEKMIHVFNKLKTKNQYQIDLNIPSFSAYPSGSIYPSDRVSFKVSTPALKSESKLKNKSQ